jgi:hypothetical protein
MAIVFSIAALAFSVITFFTLRGYVIRRTGQDRILGEFRDAVNGLVSEIDRATDRDAALVEERVTALREILAHADSRILELAAASNAAPPPPALRQAHDALATEQAAPPQAGTAEQLTPAAPPDAGIRAAVNQKNIPQAAAELEAFLASKS